MKLKKYFVRIISSMILVVVLIAGSAQSVCGATVQDPVQPRYVSIGSVTLSMSTFREGIGMATATVSKKYTADSIEATLAVYRWTGSEWKYITEWYESSTDTQFVLDGYFSVIKGYTYKAEVTVTAYTDSVGETTVQEFLHTY